MERRKPEVPNSPTVVEIKPATGEEKEQLEKRVSEMLASPEEITHLDFNSFVQDMIALTGGVKITINPNFTMLTSNSHSPLKDNQNGKHIRFHVDQLEGETRTTTSQIIVGDEADWPQENCETLIYVALYGLLGHPDQWLLEIPVLKPTPFNSYVTEKQRELIAPDTCNIIELDPSEVRKFLRKVFKVHQRQGQQPQPYTPQP